MISDYLFFLFLHFKILIEHTLYEFREIIGKKIHDRSIHYKLLRHLARQYKKWQMVLNVEWLGSEKGVYFEQGTNHK